MEENFGKRVEVVKKTLEDQEKENKELVAYHNDFWSRFNAQLSKNLNVFKTLLNGEDSVTDMIAAVAKLAEDDENAEL